MAGVRGLAPGYGQADMVIELIREGDGRERPLRLFASTGRPGRVRPGGGAGGLFIFFYYLGSHPDTLSRACLTQTP